jgi:hypothetical protein
MPSDGNAGEVSHHVRVGTALRRIRGRDPLAVWLLAHGLADQVSKWAWTSEAMTAALVGFDEDRMRAAVSELETQGLLVRLTPEHPAAIQFAHRYRLCTLLRGLGRMPRWGGWYAVGLGNEPAVKMTDFVSEIWRWAPAAPNLWSLCEAFVAADGERAGAVSSTAQILADVLRSLHLILAYNAGYLDET